MKSKFVIFCFTFLIIGISASFWTQDILNEIFKKNLTFTTYSNLEKENISTHKYNQVVKIHQECFQDTRRRNLAKYIEKYGNYGNYGNILNPELIKKRVDAYVDKQNLEQKITFRSSQNVTLATHNNDVIGMFNCLEEDEITHNSIMIYNVCIAKQFRGRGLGKQLILNAISKCKRDNKDLTLLIYKDDEIAQNLYKNVGFNYIQGKIKAEDRFEFFNKFLMIFSQSKQQK